MLVVEHGVLRDVTVLGHRVVRARIVARLRASLVVVLGSLNNLVLAQLALFAVGDFALDDPRVGGMLLVKTDARLFRQLLDRTNSPRSPRVLDRDEVEQLLWLKVIDGLPLYENLGS